MTGPPETLPAVSGGSVEVSPVEAVAAHAGTTDDVGDLDRVATALHHAPDLEAVGIAECDSRGPTLDICPGHRHPGPLVPPYRWTRPGESVGANRDH